MGYESLSTVVVLVIVAIVIVVWLPTCTANGMKRAAEHRQDRYSPSLHIVDMQRGGQFGDAEPHKAKGAAMPASNTSARLTPEHIAHVRELRRAAIRRRRIVAGCLLAVTVLVFVVSFPLRFSPLFVLIPLILLVAVLALGVNAARQARVWEDKVVRYERAQKAKATKKPALKNEPVEAAQPQVAGAAEQPEAEAVTEVMEQRQIRRVLRDAEMEQAKAKARRAAQAEAKEQSESAASVQETEAKVAAAAPDQSASETAPRLTMRDERDEAPDDATSELASVRPARALDVFDMATSQDLISFSLGSSNNTDGAPESLEIKSTRQVSRAEPVAPDVADRLISEAQAVKAADDAQAASAASATEGKAQAAADAGENDETENELSAPADENAQASQRAQFHEHEEHAEVEPPAATSESLGVGLESILARRSN